MRTVGSAQLARTLGDWQPRGDATGSSPRGAAGYARLAAALRLLILDGRLPLDVRLPSERDLAAALGVSRTTVTHAYDALRAAGHALSRRGSGTFTAVPAPRATGAPTTPWGPLDDDGIDLAHASPEAPGELRDALDAALDQLPRHLPTPGYAPLGLPELRAAVAQRFTGRGLPTTPDQILVTAGAQHAFSLVTAAMVTPGDRILIEHPTYPNAVDTARGAGARLVPVALEEAGWDTEAVRLAVRQAAPRLAYLVPDFHNPTGLLATSAEREELAAALRGGRTITVVDETLVELALDGNAGPPLASFLPDDLAITVGSLSKAVWGGLRIGWLRADAGVVRRLAVARATHDIASAVVEQLAATDLLGRLDAVLSGRRAILRERRAVLTAALATELPEWRFRLPSGGLVLWCDLGVDASSRLAVAAEQHGLRVAAGPRFGVDGAFERRLRVPYTLPVDELRVAVRQLAQAWRGVEGGRPVTGEARAALDLFA